MSLLSVHTENTRISSSLWVIVLTTCHKKEEKDEYINLRASGCMQRVDRKSALIPEGSELFLSLCCVEFHCVKVP